MSVQHDFSPLNHSFEYPVEINSKESKIKYASIREYLSMNKYSIVDLENVIRQKFDNAVMMNLLKEYFEQKYMDILEIDDIYNQTLNIYKQIFNEKYNTSCKCKEHEKTICNLASKILQLELQLSMMITIQKIEKDVKTTKLIANENLDVSRAHANMAADVLVL